jgi:hypothetical protein
MSTPKIYTVAIPWGHSDEFPIGQYVLYSEYLNLQRALSKLCHIGPNYTVEEAEKIAREALEPLYERQPSQL